jgi:hypothetical protein
MFFCRVESVRNKLNENFIRQVYIPGGCTGELQPLDLKINDPFKKQMKQLFIEWYSEQVKEVMDKDGNLDDVNINLGMSTIKPIHARWLISAVTTISQKQELIKSSFISAGLVPAE